jgi:hypothetical protein
MNWIDVKDGYPTKDGMLVVVFDPQNHPTVWPAKWDAKNRTFDSNGGWFERDEVTHWMPLPPPPKSKEWLEGFKAAEHDDTHNDFTHCPYQPTSPWTYPDGHAGPPTKQAVEWEAGYDYRMFEYNKMSIQLEISIDTGNGVIKTVF